MKLKTEDILKLAAAYGAGSITASALEEEYGYELAGSIMSLTAGFGAGMLAEAAVTELLNTKFGQTITQAGDSILKPVNDVAGDAIDLIGEVGSAAFDIAESFFDW